MVDPAYGWHLFTQPLFSPYPQSGLLQTVQDNARWIAAVPLAIYTGFVFRYRPAAVDAAALLWVVVYAFSPNFFLNYLVYGLPFFIMAGFLVEVAVLQALLIAPTVAYYVVLSPAPSTATGVLYVPALIALWGAWVLATLAIAWRVVEQRKQDFHPSPVAARKPLLKRLIKLSLRWSGYVFAAAPFRLPVAARRKRDGDSTPIRKQLLPMQRSASCEPPDCPIRITSARMC